jgi:protein-tyrosine-phosphatase
MAASTPPLADVFVGGLQYPIRVLFLCTGNSARSQIAEALLTKKGGDRFVVASAGMSPAKEVRPEALAALRARGIDWSAAKPKGLDRIVEVDWDMVITLCDRARESCPNLPSRPVTAHWGIPDPSETTDVGHRANAFDDTVMLLSWRIDLMLALRTELLERLVIEERLKAIATLVPPSQPTTSTGTP